MFYLHKINIRHLTLNLYFIFDVNQFRRNSASPFRAQDAKVIYSHTEIVLQLHMLVYSCITCYYLNILYKTFKYFYI